MHQFVQSAIEAAKQGDNQKAMAFIKQVLNSNPNDVDAWLVLAAIVDDPQRKRQCLNRVLKLDPSNLVAREELEEMDRAEMGGHVSPFTSDSFGLTQEEPAPVSTPLYQPEPSSSFYSTGTSAFEPEETPPPPPPAQTKPQISTKAPVKSPTAQKGKTQVFRYSLYVQIMLYAGAVFCGLIGFLMLTQNMFSMGATVIGAGVLLLVLVMVLLPVAEVSDKGISASGFFSSGEATWDEIVKIKANKVKSRLEITKRNKQVINVSTQLSGYPQIVEILRLKRPELFGMAPKPQIQTRAVSSTYDNDNRASADYDSHQRTPATESYKGSRTFKKGFFRQYGWIFIIIPFCLCSLSAALENPSRRIGASIAVFFSILAIFAPFFQVGTVKVQANKMSLSTFFGTKDFSSQEISDIYIKSARRRYGGIVHFVCIRAKGKEYDLEGFPDSEEIIYGALTNWLEANRR